MDEPVRITDHGDGLLDVLLYGDIDFANSPSVRETIRAAVADATPTAIRVDLGAVTFLDSSGIAVLVIVHRLASAVGARYTVVSPNPAVYEHLRLTGLADLFGVTGPTPGKATDPTGAGPGGPEPPVVR